MNKFIVLAAVVAVAVAEAPISGGYGGGGGSGGGGSAGGVLNEYVDEALLARVAAVLASNGDGTGTQQDNEGVRYVDASVLQQVQARLGDGGSSGPSSSYGPPQGSPSLGQPEPAQRIAEWDLTETRQTGNNNAGGYPGATGGGYPGASAPAPAQGYGAPSRGGQASSSSSSGGIRLGRPEVAQQVAEFELPGQSNGGPSRGGSAGYSQGGSQGGYN